MKPTTLTSLLMLGASAQAAALLPREAETSFKWQASQFSVESVDYSPTRYELQLKGEGETVSCYKTNSVESHVCPGAHAPTPFASTKCSKDKNSYTKDKDSYFSWEFSNTTSPVMNGGEIFFIKFTYQKPGQKALVGCSPAFSAKNVSCVGPMDHGEILHVPSSFTATEGSNGECIFV